MTDLNNLNDNNLNNENMSQENLSQEILSKDSLAADLEKAKREGKTRIDRLREIGQIAAAAALGELKEGSKELGTIAKDSLSTAAASFNSAANSATNSATEDGTANGATNSDHTPSSEASNQPAFNLSTLLVTLYQTLKEGVRSLDATLSERYGDRYYAAKQQAQRQFEQTATWYNKALEEAKANPAEPTLLEQKQNELAAKAESAGAFIAKTEQLIRQRLKEMAEMNVVRR